jgi:hypothetical protein
MAWSAVSGLDSAAHWVEDGQQGLETASVEDSDGFGRAAGVGMCFSVADSVGLATDNQSTM